MEKTVERLAKWFNGKEAGPVQLEINLTNKCNLECPACWRFEDGEEIRDFGDELRDKRFLELVDEGYDLGVRKVFVSGGGEPLVKEQLFLDMANKIKSKDMKGKLITNGTLFSDSTIKELVDMGWDSILFSLDGPDAETNDEMRPGEQPFQRTVKNIKKFVEYKEENKNSKPKLELVPVLSKKNYQRAKEFVELASRLEIEGVTFQLMVETNEYSKSMLLNEEERKELKDIMSETMELAKRRGIECNGMSILQGEVLNSTSTRDKVMLSNSRKSGKDPALSMPCYRPWYFISVYPDGSVKPCPNIPEKISDYDMTDEKTEKKIKRQNVRKKKLSEIWFGDYFNEYRGKIRKKSLFPWCEICCGNEIFDTEKMRNKLEKRLKQ